MSKAISILPSQLENTEFARQSLTVTAKSEQTPEEFLDPVSWAAVQPKIRPRDEITVICEDGSWIMQLYVMSTGQGWIKPAKLQLYNLIEAVEGDEPDDQYAVMWRGKGKWTVLRTEDNSTIKNGFEAQEDALKFRNEYIKTQNL